MTNKSDDRTLHQLRLMATKLQNDPTTVAWIISTYLKQEHLSWEKLSTTLGTTEQALVKLALCKRPNSNSNDFKQQVTQLAQYANIDLVLLTNMIRQVESVTALSGKVGKSNVTGQTSAQLGFSAARDKNEGSSTVEDADEARGKGDVAD
jgi:hypothetical protein